MATLYERKLLNEPEVRRKLNAGRELPESVSLEFDNSDGYFSDLVAGGEDFRGKRIHLERYDEDGNQTTEVYGTVCNYNILDRATFEVRVQDPDALQTLLPQKVYETDDWRTHADGNVNDTTIINPAHDLGKPYPIIFGYAKKVPLIYVYANYDSDYYDYIIGYGPVEGVDYVYRDQVLVDSGEYTFNDGSDGKYTDSDGNAYAYIRFILEQIDFRGALYELTADVKGLKMGGAAAERNFATIIGQILSNTGWGLSLSVNAASFTASDTVLTDLLCDGAITEQQPAQDITDHLCWCGRSWLKQNADGEWEIVTDQANATVSACFGQHDGYYENIIKVDRFSPTPVDEATRNVVVNYGLNPWTGEYAGKISRSVNASFGEDHTTDLPFVRDGDTADRIACYYQRLETYGKYYLTLTVGLEGEDLDIQDVVDVAIKHADTTGTLKTIVDDTFMVKGISRRLSDFSLSCRLYDSDIYTYAAGSIPTSPIDDDEADYSGTAPTAPTALAVDASGTQQGTDGMTIAYFDLSATAPASNFSHMLFGWKLSAASAYTWVEGTNTAGTTWGTRINGLVPGQNYDVIAKSVNGFNLTADCAAVASQTAPGDTSAPATVSGVTGSSKYKSLSFVWTANSEADLAGYHVQIGNSTFSTVYFDKYIDGNSVSFSSDSLSYGVTYYCRVKAVDFTGNESSAWSSNGTTTTAKTDTDDLEDDSVTYTKIDVATLSAISANIGTITAGILQNTNVEFNLTNETLGIGKSSYADTSAGFWADGTGKVHFGNANVQLRHNGTNIAVTSSVETGFTIDRLQISAILYLSSAYVSFDASSYLAGTASEKVYLTGGYLNIQAADIKLYGSSYSTIIGVDATGAAFNILPDTTDVVTVNFGNTTYMYNDWAVYANDLVTLRSYSDATHYAIIDIDRDATNAIDIRAYNGYDVSIKLKPAADEIWYDSSLSVFTAKVKSSNGTNSGYGALLGNLSIGGYHATSRWNCIDAQSNQPVYINIDSTGGVSLCYGGGNVGIGMAPSTYELDVNGTINADDATAAVKAFCIDHPLFPTDKWLRHVCVEAPRADLIYRGTATVAGGTATVDIDLESGMSPGTLEALCQDIEVLSIRHKAGKAAACSDVTGGRFEITGDDGKVVWVVVGTRNDPALVENVKPVEQDKSDVQEGDLAMVNDPMLAGKQVSIFKDRRGYCRSKTLRQQLGIAIPTGELKNAADGSGNANKRESA